MSLFTRTLALGLFPLAVAQWKDGNTLGSCEDIGCPLRTDNKTNHKYACQFDQDYPSSRDAFESVGIDTFPSIITKNGNDNREIKNLTWTLGKFTYDSSWGGNYIDGNWLLFGAPESLNPDYTGCAVFFSTRRGPRSEKDKCEDLLGQECHADLLAAARMFASSRVSQIANGTVCQDLQNRLSSSTSECDRTLKFWHAARKQSA